MGEIAHIGAVLVHDRQAFAAVFARAGLVDEGDAGVEEALFAGHLGEDRVRDDMGDAPRIVGVGDILLARRLRSGGDVPQAEFGLHAAVAAAARAAGDDILRVDGA